jgi:hypothetical protein
LPLCSRSPRKQGLRAEIFGHVSGAIYVPEVRDFGDIQQTLVCETDQSGRARASLGPHDQKGKSSACFTTGSSGDHRACSSSNSRLRVRMIPCASLLPSYAIEVRVFVASNMGSSPYELRHSPLLRSWYAMSRNGSLLRGARILCRNVASPAPARRERPRRA